MKEKRINSFFMDLSFLYYEMLCSQRLMILLYGKIKCIDIAIKGDT